MESSSWTSSDSDAASRPSVYRPLKRRRTDKAPDGLPSMKKRGSSAQKLGNNPHQTETSRIPHSGFFTIHEEHTDVLRTEFHLPKAQNFVDRVRLGYKARWQHRHSPYTDVSSLLLYWQEDDLGVKTEVEDLNNILKETYQFQTEIWGIPSCKTTYLSLAQKVHSFVEENDGEGKLLILYYGGHAYRKGRSQPIWVSNGNGSKTEVSSDMVFAGLKDLTADVLLLFDSCQAIPEPFNAKGKGIVSVLASTGFEPSFLSAAPVPGRDSFTRSLINELCEISNPKRPGCSPETFSDVSLHSKIMERLMFYKPEPLKCPDGSYMRDPNNNHMIEPYRRRTPIYRCLTENRTPYPICITPLQRSIPTPESSIQSTSDDDTEDQAKSTHNRSCDTVPCVLISVRLNPHCLDKLDIESWVKLLLSMPSTAEDVTFNMKEITIENYYQSCSGLMIVKMPLDIWNWMPKDPAIILIGCVRGENQAPAINEQLEQQLRGSLSSVDRAVSSDPIKVRPNIGPHASLQSRKAAFLLMHQQTGGLKYSLKSPLEPEPFLPPEEIQRSVVLWRDSDGSFGLNNPASKEMGTTTTMKLENGSKTIIDLDSLGSNNRYGAWPDIEDDEAVLEWLMPSDCIKQSDSSPQWRNESGQWLLESEQYRAWTDHSEDTNMLFCSGIPGSGKTTMVKLILDDLKNVFRNDETTGITYFFFHFHHQHEQTLEHVLATLLKQLARGLSFLPTTIKSLYNKHSAQRTRPSSKELSNSLQCVIALHFTRAFVIIDGLDECEVATRDTLISEIFGFQAIRQVSVLVTSRLIPDIMEKFTNCALWEVRADAEYMRKYVSNHILQVLPSIGDDPTLQTDIVSAIVESASGMFRIVQCWFDSLVDIDFLEQIEIPLSQILLDSEAFGDLYDETMERINTNLSGKDLAKQVLSWIAFAKRPLTTTELWCAVDMSQRRSQNSERLPKVKSLASICAGLVAVDEENDVVEFVHWTVREFLQSTRNHWFPNAEDAIAAVCIEYLSLNAFGSGFCQTDSRFEERLWSHPLYKYAAHHWGHHICEPSHLLYEFLKNESKLEASSQAMLARKRWPGHTRYSQHVPRQLTALHMVAYFGLAAMVESFCDEICAVDLEDTYERTPLSYAVEEGHLEAVVVLLRRGADVNKYDIHGQTPLHWAIINGSMAMVELLLGAGAHADAHGSRGQTPLLRAVRYNSPCIVKVLLEAGADHQTLDNNDQTPLSLAIMHRNMETVKLLLDVSSDVQKKDAYDWKSILSLSHKGWFIVPHRRNDNFVGRSSILERLQRDAGDKCLHTRMSLCGLGGIGKTEIALEYAYQLRKTRSDVSVFWITVGSWARTRQSFNFIAQSCQIPGYKDPGIDEISLVKRWLENDFNSPWLMIIDNADDPQLFSADTDKTRGRATLENYLPNSQHGTILMTTRSREIAITLTGKPPIAVNQFSPLESRQLLCRLLMPENPLSSKLAALTSKLGHHPLSLVLAAGCIQNKFITIDEFIASLSRNAKDNLVSSRMRAEPGDDPLEFHFENIEPWSTLFERVLSKHTFAREILFVLTIFDSQAVPPEILTCYSERWGQDGRGQARLEEAISILQSFSLITVNKDRSLNIHQLVKLGIKKRIAEEKVTDSLIQGVLLAVHQAYCNENFEDWTNCGRYLPHVSSLLAYEGSGKQDKTREKAELLHCMAVYLLYRGQWSDAKKYLHDALLLSMEVLGNTHPNTLSIMRDLALEYNRHGQFKEAMRLMQICFNLQQRKLGEAHSHTTTTSSILRKWKKKKQ